MVLEQIASRGPITNPTKARGCNSRFHHTKGSFGYGEIEWRHGLAPTLSSLLPWNRARRFEKIRGELFKRSGQRLNRKE